MLARIGAVDHSMRQSSMERVLCCRHYWLVEDVAPPLFLITPCLYNHSSFEVSGSAIQSVGANVIAIACGSHVETCLRSPIPPHWSLSHVRRPCVFIKLFVITVLIVYHYCHGHCFINVIK